MINDDVLIVGAGPAGSVAATLLARTGLRVRLVDRVTFPRDKLCGDTVSPGTLAILRGLGIAAGIEGCGLRVDGMRVTGENGVVVEGRYPPGVHGRALLRRDLDWLLLQQATAAGAQFEPGVAVRSAVVRDDRVGGAIVSGRIANGGIRARVVIAADGRRSTLAFGLGLARHPQTPRRWAIGAYYEGIEMPGAFGEMHVRRGRYIGVAAVPGGRTNVCLVRPSHPGDAAVARPAALLEREIARDAMLRQRLTDARLASRPVVLGPLAVDLDGHAMDGLLLAGDAAGFVDPITGDGLRFAIAGAELAARAALEALEHGWNGVHRRLASRRRDLFRYKWRFNRAVRALVGSPAAVAAATLGTRVAPAILRAAIVYAADCQVASSGATRGECVKRSHCT